MKKSTLKLFFSMIVFIAVFLALYFNIENILRSKTGNQSDMIHSFYDIEKDSLDVLVLGSSHAYCGYQPNVVWETQGFTSYVMGSPQQSLAMSYFLLKEALQYQSPQVVLLESYYFQSVRLYNSDARLHAAVDGIRLGPVKLEMINEILGADEEITFKKKLEYYLPFYLYHDRWDELLPEDFESRTYLKGSTVPRTRVFENENQGVDVPAKEIPEVSLKYFQKIKQLCEENDVALVVFQVPYNILNESTYVKLQGVNVTLESYLEEQGIPFLFYQKTGEADIDYATDFFDESHLNMYGQTKISKCLGEYLAENYDISDHRGDPAYASWEADYLQFDADRQQLLADIAESTGQAQDANADEEV